MSIFKQKLQINQFVSVLIAMQIDTFNQNFEALLIQAGETDITDKHKEILKAQIPSIIAANAMLDLVFHYPRSIDSHAASSLVVEVMAGYLKQETELSNKEIENQLGITMDLVERFVAKVDESEVNTQDIKGPRLSEVDQAKFSLCEAFSEMYLQKSGQKLTDAGDPSFIAFQLAKAVVKSNAVKDLSKEYKIAF